MSRDGLSSSTGALTREIDQKGNDESLCVGVV